MQLLSKCCDSKHVNELCTNGCSLIFLKFFFLSKELFKRDDKLVFVLFIICYNLSSAFSLSTSDAVLRHSNPVYWQTQKVINRIFSSFVKITFFQFPILHDNMYIFVLTFPEHLCVRVDNLIWMILPASSSIFRRSKRNERKNRY